MKRNIFKKLKCAALAGAAIISGAGTVTGMVCAPVVTFADEIDDLMDQRDQLQEQQKQLEEQKKQLEEQKKKTEEEKQKTEKELRELEEQIKKLIDEINALDNQLSELMVKIYETNSKLEAQTEKQDKQYNDMSLRIRYMYEDSNNSVSEALISSKSMDGVLNAAEYFRRIYSYDRAQLEEIKETRNKIEELKKTLEDEFAEVQKMEEEVSAKRAEVAKIAEEKKDKVAALDGELAQTINSIADTERANKEAQQAYNDTNAAINAAVGARLAALGSADAAQLIDLAKKARESAEGYNANAPANVVAETAALNKGTFPCNLGWCAAWVSGVYNAAGVLPPHGNAIDYWNKWKHTGSTSMTDIPVGAAVISSGAGYDGSVYGHIGIHIGGGVVASNIGYCKIETVESFGMSATATCQGHRGYIGWVWPNGNVLSVT